MSPIPTWGADSEGATVWPTPRQQLLLQAALIPDERALDAWSQIRPEMEVAALDGAVLAVLPQLRANLLALGVDDDPLFGLFKGVHRYVWAENQLLLARLMPFVGEIEQAGISTLLLKGSAIVAGTGVDAGMRPMKDLDVLVPSDRTEDAIDVLVRSGLQPTGGVPDWYITGYVPAYESGYSFEMTERGRSLRLDLHWHATHVSQQDDADQDFWATARNVDLHGVRTHALAATDELLLAIVHGLQWDPLPTYRWVVDASRLLRGGAGTVDFERLLEQARRRRVSATVGTGLSYLRRVVSAPVPPETIRALRRSRPGPLERLELRAESRAPASRGTLDWLVLRHQYFSRRVQPLGERASLSPASLRRLIGARRPGPGRPLSLVAAPIGDGRPRSALEATPFGQVIQFDDPERVRRHFLYGAWYPDASGCWLAGREARLVVRLARPPQGSLLLGLWADALLIGRTKRQRLEVLVNGAPAARFELTADHGWLRDEGIVLSHEAVAGRDVVELTFRMPDATSEQPGDIVDDRMRSILLRRLAIREPALCEPGRAVSLGLGSGDEAVLAGGFSLPDSADGRWTFGDRARFLVRVAHDDGPLALSIDALPIRDRQRVRLSVNGGRPLRTRWNGSNRVSLPVQANGGELLVDLRIKDPVSPAQLGLSDDGRPLGLFIRSLELVPH